MPRQPEASQNKPTERPATSSAYTRFGLFAAGIAACAAVFACAASQDELISYNLRYMGMD